MVDILARHSHGVTVLLTAENAEIAEAVRRRDRKTMRVLPIFFYLSVFFASFAVNYYATDKASV